MTRSFLIFFTFSLSSPILVSLWLFNDVVVGPWRGRGGSLFLASHSSPVVSPFRINARRYSHRRNACGRAALHARQPTTRTSTTPPPPPPPSFHSSRRRHRCSSFHFSSSNKLSHYLTNEAFQKSSLSYSWSGNDEFIREFFRYTRQQVFHLLATHTHYILQRHLLNKISNKMSNVFIEQRTVHC